MVHESLTRLKLLKRRAHQKIQDISTISELKYADGSSISAIDSDLLRVPIKSKDISDNVKKQSLRQKMRIFGSTMGLSQKLFCGRR